MFIINAILQLDLGCDCDDCDKSITVTFDDSTGVIPRVYTSDVLNIAKERRWIVNEGMAFCSNACEDKSRNQILSGDRVVYNKRMQMP